VGVVYTQADGCAIGQPEDERRIHHIGLQNTVQRKASPVASDPVPASQLQAVRIQMQTPPEQRRGLKAERSCAEWHGVRGSRPIVHRKDVYRGAEANGRLMLRQRIPRRFRKWDNPFRGCDMAHLQKRMSDLQMQLWTYRAPFSGNLGGYCDGEQSNRLLNAVEKYEAEPKPTL